MKVGWIGLGKLGLPCALAMASRGVEVMGYDVEDDVRRAVRDRRAGTRIEDGMEQLLSTTELQVGHLPSDVIEFTDELIFVAVQTPHHPDYGGEKPMPQTTVDFDYTALRAAVRRLNEEAEAARKHVTIVVISTALPGTMDREIMPLLGEFVSLVYNPFFIAMGTTIRDFLAPEFVLVGSMINEPDITELVVQFYDQLYAGEVPIKVMSYSEAELTKVAYNTFISMKIVFANTLLEISDKLGLSVDVVTDALGDATRRLISPAYMTGGVGDGGACHPRDNIAMSWLASKLDLAADPFEFVTRAREEQSLWLAETAARASSRSELPIVVLGKAYKPGSDLTYGSPAALVVHQLVNQYNVDIAEWWDPYVDKGTLAPTMPAVYVVMTKHPDFADFEFAAGSIVLDPFRYIEQRDEIVYHGLGDGIDG